jgi:Secretion system C-terminal sorting domain
VLSKTMVCVGGSVSLTASGANTYSWNTGSQTNVNIQNPTNTTVYSVVGTFTDTQCATTKTVSVVVFAPQITVSSPTTVCIGSSATLTATGGNPGAYVWSNGLNFQTIVVTPTVLTPFVCTAPTTSNNLTCSSSASTQVSVNPLPIINVAATKTVMCRKDAGAVLTATGGSTYAWSTGATTSTILASSAVATTSNYVVTGTDANGCVNTFTISIKVNTCTGIGEWSDENSLLSVYPNPNNGSFEVKGETEMQLTLMNELGQQVQTLQLNSQNNFTVKLNDLSSGVYFLVGQNESGRVNQKIVVTK